MFDSYVMHFIYFQDYTGEDVTVDNFFAVLLGNKTAVKGGSGKVVNSGPNDHIFVFYSDHGGPGVLGKLFHLLYYLFSKQFYKIYDLLLFS